MWSVTALSICSLDDCWRAQVPRSLLRLFKLVPMAATGFPGCNLSTIVHLCNWPTEDRGTNLDPLTMLQIRTT
jgi:hypothetical protein